MVRFINRNNYIISHRYSILVRQFVQSNEAFTFYETLNDLSRNESLFSETQPGFLAGNVSSTAVVKINSDTSYGILRWVTQ